MVMTEEAEKILEMVRALPGEIGLVIRDTVTGEEISWGKDTPVVAASVIKILVMAEPERQRPMEMTMGPVTTGGKYLRTRSEPNPLISPAMTK